MNDTVKVEVLKHDLRRAARGVILPLAPLASLAALFGWHGLEHGKPSAWSMAVLLAVLAGGAAAMSTGAIFAARLLTLAIRPRRPARGDGVAHLSSPHSA